MLPISVAARRHTVSSGRACESHRANDMNGKSTMNKASFRQVELHDGLAERHVLDDLLDDPDRCTSMGALGRSRVESTLAWHHRVPQLLKAYDARRRPGALEVSRHTVRMSDPATPFEPSVAGNQPWRAPAFCREMRNLGSKAINVRRVAGEGK